MKKLITLIVSVFVTSAFIFAQSPDRMSYQAVVRDGNNEIVENQDVGVQISILHNSATGTVSYTESQVVTTNENGLLTLIVGDGNVVTGQIDTIDWANGPYFITSQIDPTGGTNYTISGSSELLSVPYALHAKTTSGGGATGNAGGDLSGTYPNPTVADDAITTNKIADGAVTGAKIEQMGATNDDVLGWDGAEWTPTALSGSNWTVDGSDIYYDTGNVSIGSTNNYGSRLFLVGDGTQRVMRAQSPSGITKFLIEADGGVSIGSGLTAAPADGLLVGGESIFDSRAIMNANDIDSVNVLNFSGSGGESEINSGTYDQMEYYADDYLWGHRFYVEGAQKLRIRDNEVIVYDDFSVNGAKNFKIDHPADPENKYLYHAAIESDVPYNKYSGNITTDANGEATVELPEYVELVNKDFRYNLTVIGTFAQAIVGEEVSGNKFIIRTDEPNVKVSWELTGVRNDPYMQQNPYQTEVDKEGEEVGVYMNPELYSQPKEKGMEQREQKKTKKNVIEKKPIEDPGEVVE